MALVDKSPIYKEERTMVRTKDTRRHMSMQAQLVNGAEEPHLTEQHHMGKVGGTNES